MAINIVDNRHFYEFEHTPSNIFGTSPVGENVEVVKQTFVLAIGCLLLVGCSNSHIVSSVQEIDKLPNDGNRGSTIRIELKTGESVTGALLAVGDTLLAVYSGSLGGANDTIFFAGNLHILERTEINSLVITSPPRGISPTIIGLGIGGVFGLLTSSGAEDDGPGHGGPGFNRGQKVAFSVAGFGMLGALAGTIAGVASAKPNLIISHPEKQHWIALRRLVRFPDAHPAGLHISE